MCEHVHIIIQNIQIKNEHQWDATLGVGHPTYVCIPSKISVFEFKFLSPFIINKFKSILQLVNL